MKQLFLCVALAGVFCLSGCATSPSGEAASPSPPPPAGPGEGPERGETAAGAPDHFWFDYNHPPHPGKRVWVRVDRETWIELYPNGLESRYRSRERTTVGALNGTVVEKVSGDPEQTLTLNDGSFQVFIPDRDNERLVLAFRHFEEGRWGGWQPLGLLELFE